MKCLQHIVRVALVCAAVSAALAGGYAWAGLTGDQADTLQTQAASGDKAALARLKAAAQQWDAAAQFTLGLLYHKGQGVPQDYTQAAQWWRKAAQQGNADAQALLGSLYGLGQGVLQNQVAAYALANLAALDASSDGDKLQSALSQDMTNQEIAAGQALSMEMNRPGNLLKALDAYLAGRR